MLRKLAQLYFLHFLQLNPKLDKKKEKPGEKNHVAQACLKKDKNKFCVIFSFKKREPISSELSPP
jgi:hypothetical protein